jgi:hypothetical protein
MFETIWFITIRLPYISSWVFHFMTYDRPLVDWHFVHHTPHMFWPVIVLTGRWYVSCAMAQTTVTRNRLFYYCWAAHCRGSNTVAEWGPMTYI